MRAVKIVNQVAHDQPTTGVQHPDVIIGASAVGVGEINERTGRVYMMTEGGDVRVTYDGREPSNAAGAEVGKLFYDGAIFNENSVTASRMKFVAAASGVSVVLRISEFE